MINTMHSYHWSAVRRNTERYPTVTYTPCALATLTSFIMMPHTDSIQVQLAITAFERGTAMLENIALGFMLGRRVLQRLVKPIKATRARIADLRVTINADQGGMMAPEGLGDENLFDIEGLDAFLTSEGLSSFPQSPNALARLLGPTEDYNSIAVG
jgi:hypothetical protein